MFCKSKFLFAANKEMEEQHQDNTRKLTELLAERGMFTKRNEKKLYLLEILPVFPHNSHARIQGTVNM